MTLRALVADDEAPARRKIAHFLSVHGDVEVVAEASNGVDALDLMTLTKPNIAFLDIQMPDLDGLGVAEVLASHPSPPAIVFVTAFDRYAIKAFDVRALDYLLKPYDRDRFELALRRAREAVEMPQRSPDLAQLLAQARNEGRYVSRLLIPGDGKSFFVAMPEIVRLEAGEGGVLVHTSRGAHAIRSTLETLEERLDPARFVRVHRSHIVNIEAIRELRPWFHGDGKLRLVDGTELPLSRRYAAKRPELFK